MFENSTGAGGTIGVGRVARATPDGYTLGLGHWSTHVVNGAIYISGGRSNSPWRIVAPMSRATCSKRFRPPTLYVLKLILDDWNDHEGIEILSNLGGVAACNGRVLIVDPIVPGPDESHFAKLFDSQMMRWGRAVSGSGTRTCAFLRLRGGSISGPGILTIG